MRALKTSLADWRPRARGLSPIDVIRAHWPAIAGADIARHAVPASLEKSSLIVTTRSGAWSQQLGYLGPDLLARLRELPEGREVASFVFRVGRIAPRVGVAAPRHRPVQRALKLTVEAPPPAASLEELLARIIARAAARERELARATRCGTCGVPIDAAIKDRGVRRCVPCADRVRHDRVVAASRALREMPWLAAAAAREIVPGLELEEFARARRGLQSRLEQRVDQIRWRVRNKERAHPDERSIILSYVMLVTGEPPPTLSDALVRNTIGSAFARSIFD